MKKREADVRKNEKDTPSEREDVSCDKKRGNRLSGFLLFCSLFFFLAALLWLGWMNYHEQRAKENLETLMTHFSAEDLRLDQIKEAAAGRKGVESFDEAMVHWPDPTLPMPTKEVDGILCIGLLSIPDLSMTFPVLDENNHENLERAPVRYSGSLYARNLIICGHNYRSIFKRLDELAYNSLIYFRDMAGNSYAFRLLDTEIIPGEDVRGMLAGAGDWDLTLYTCTPYHITRLTLRFALCAFVPANTR